ncbi:unnamed protein product [Brassica oleracea var. botrytis]|uniref:(rape) hypothetical protein n=1 Tax=Brassica napus TaxID=3708 RepID=A0A816JEV1_BRANA|nr:unnamed protein product [Brassica napus]
MIYRKWSLLSGPPVILGGAVVAAIAVGIVLQNVYSCSISFFSVDPKIWLFLMIRLRKGSKRRMSHQTSEIMDNEKKTLATQVWC